MMRRPRRSPLFPYPTFFGPRRTPLVPSTSIWYSFGRELRAGGAIASRRNRLPPSAEVGRRKALAAAASSFFVAAASGRSEERRVGEEGRSRWSPDYLKKKKKHIIVKVVLIKCINLSRHGLSRLIITLNS